MYCSLTRGERIGPLEPFPSILTYIQISKGASGSSEYCNSPAKELKRVPPSSHPSQNITTSVHKLDSSNAAPEADASTREELKRTTVKDQEKPDTADKFAKTPMMCLIRVLRWTFESLLIEWN